MLEIKSIRCVVLSSGPVSVPNPDTQSRLGPELAQVPNRGTTNASNNFVTYLHSDLSTNTFDNLIKFQQYFFTKKLSVNALNSIIAFQLFILFSLFSQHFDNTSMLAVILAASSILVVKNC